MAEPAQLFSTLVQAAATVIALTLGFASTLYDSRIDSIQEKTDVVRAKFVNLRDKYQSVADSMALKLQEQGDFDDPTRDNIDPGEWMDQYGAEQTAAMVLYESQRIDMSVEDINDWAENQSDTQTARAWALLKNISGILNDITDLSGNLIDRDQFHELRDSVSGLEDLFNPGSDENDELYRELTGEESGSGHHVESIFDESEVLTNWLNNHIEEIDERREGWSSIEPHADGTNITSFGVIIGELKIDVFQTVGKMPGSSLLPQSDPVARTTKFLSFTAGLGVFGILLPLLFLITPSGILQIRLPLWAFQLAQAIFIIGSIIFSFLLFAELYDFIRQRAGDI